MNECPLERLFQRCCPEVPADAASRVLGALPQAEVQKALYWGEVGRVASRFARWSLLGALLGLGTLAGAIAGSSVNVSCPMTSRPDVPPEPCTISEIARTLAGYEREATAVVHSYLFQRK